MGALLSAVYHENEAPALIDIELTRSVGILIGERYNEENSDHRGRKVYRGHGGFDVVANKWSEIANLVRFF